MKNIQSTYYRRGPEKRLQPGVEWPVSWREARGYAGVAGIPPWNPARYFVFRQFVQATASENSRTLDQELNNVNTLMAKVGANDPAQITAATTRAAQTVDALLTKVINQQMGQDLAGTLLRNITGDGTAIAGAGFRVAEQAVMALQTFIPIAQKNGKPLRQEPLVTDKISNLLRSVEKPASYDPQQFATQMRAIHSFLMQ